MVTKALKERIKILGAPRKCLNTLLIVIAKTQKVVPVKSNEKKSYISQEYKSQQGLPQCDQILT